MQDRSTAKSIWPHSDVWSNEKRDGTSKVRLSTGELERRVYPEARGQSRKAAGHNQGLNRPKLSNRQSIALEVIPP